MKGKEKKNRECHKTDIEKIKCLVPLQSGHYLFLTSIPKL